MKKVVNSNKAPAAIGPYSQAIEIGNMIFVSGQLPINKDTGAFPSDDVKDQTKQSLENVKSILEEAGYKMSDVVKTTVMLSDIGDFGSMNDIYGMYFAEPYPARCAYQVAALPKMAKVEIEVIASK